MKVKPILLCILLIAGSILGSGCGKVPPAEDAAGLDSTKNQILVTSFYPVYISVLNIVKDVPGIKVISMTKNQQGCLHDYALKPADIKMLEKAKAFVINGAGMESFMDKAVKQIPGLQIIDSGIGIEPIYNKSDGEVNGHTWVSISNQIKQVETIGVQLKALDPAHAAMYEKNTKAYVKRLEALRDKMHSRLDGLKDRKIITFHESFPYFAKEFNLEVVAVIEREPGTEPSAGELGDTIDIVSKAGVKSLFAEPQYPAKAAGTIARETSAKVYVLDPVVSGPNDPDAYINLMEKNLQVLEEALK